MKLHNYFLASLVLLGLVACGGGSGDTNSNSPQPAVKFAQLSHNQTGAMTFERIFTVGFSTENLPDAGIYVSSDGTKNGYVRLDNVFINEDGSGIVQLVMLSGSALSGAPGQLTDSLQLKFCIDESCTKQVRGAPVNLTFNVDYPRVKVSETSFSMELMKEQMISGSSHQFNIPMQNPSNDTIYGKASYTGDGLLYRVNARPTNSSESFTLDLEFFGASSTEKKVMSNRVSLTMCYDPNCNKIISEQSVVLTIDQDLLDTDTAGPNAVLSNRTTLPFDIIDSTSVAELNSVAIASGWPENAIYLISLTDFSFTKVSIPKKPSSIAANGKRVVAGHDALVSLVDFSAAQPVAELYTVPMAVFDLELTTDSVQITDSASSWSSLHSLDLSTGVVYQSTGRAVYTGSKITRHPTQNWIYLATNGLSPGDISKADVSTQQATVLYDSPYHGDYEMCGDLWLSDNGNRIYTKCGNTFLSSDNQQTDMTYAGQIELSDGYRIKSIIDSSSKNELFVAEAGSYQCSWYQDVCFDRIVRFDKEFLNNKALRTLPFATFDGRRYQQLILGVAYNGDQTKQYLLLEVVDSPSAETKYAIAEFSI